MGSYKKIGKGIGIATGVIFVALFALTFIPSGPYRNRSVTTEAKIALSSAYTLAKSEAGDEDISKVYSSDSFWKKLLKKMDTDGDGKLSRKEWMNKFKKMDVDNDGFVTKKEKCAWKKSK